LPNSCRYQDYVGAHANSALRWTSVAALPPVPHSLRGYNPVDVMTPAILHGVVSPDSQTPVNWMESVSGPPLGEGARDGTTSPSYPQERWVF